MGKNDRNHKIAIFQRPNPNNKLKGYLQFETTKLPVGTAGH